MSGLSTEVEQSDSNEYDDIIANILNQAKIKSAPNGLVPIKLDTDADTDESNWYDNLFGTKDGNMLGLNKDQWSGLGTLSGIGQGLYGLYQGGKRADLLKGYYDHQMGLQNEQAQMARDEYARLNQQREDATNRFMGTTPKKPTETA